MSLRMGTRKKDASVQIGGFHSMFEELESRLLLSVLLHYDFSGEPGNQASTAADYVAPHMTATPVTRGSGVTATTKSGWTDCMTSSGWTTSSSLDLGDYYSMGVWTVQPGHSMTLTYLYYAFEWDSSGPYEFALRFSQDGFVTNTQSSKTSYYPNVGMVSAKKNLIYDERLANIAGSIEFRLYAYDSNSYGNLRILNNTAYPNINGLVLEGTISNVNEAPTDIALSSGSVAENQPVGTTVGTLSTVDPDAGDTFTYSLASGIGDTDNGLFTIAGNALQTTAAFDYETMSSYSIRLRTTDQGGLWYEEPFTISVTNVNEAPTDIALSNSSVAENQPAGTAVGALSSTDPDVGNTFTYSLVAGTGGTDNGSFTISGSTLQTAAAFDFETKSSYSVRLRTTDQGGLWYEEPFTINVTNVNEAPTDIALSSSSVAENQPSGSLVGVLSGTDPDAGQSAALAFTLVPGYGDNVLFSIDPATKQLKTAAVFDYESQNSYSIMVRATDTGSPPLTHDEPFIIGVLDVPEAAVGGRRAFFNSSVWDGGDPLPNQADDGAIATNIIGLPAGEAPSGAHVSGYSKGLNGIMVDIDGLADPDGLGLDDFEFWTNNTADPTGWAPVVAGPGITVREGEGAGGSDRVTIIWDDGAVVGTWLEVTVKAGGHTGLAADDVFYFGNLPGDFNGDGAVDVSDLSLLAGVFRQPVPITGPGDANGDGVVDVSDLSILAGRFRQSLPDIDAIRPAGGAPAGAVVFAETASLDSSEDARVQTEESWQLVLPSRAYRPRLNEQPWHPTTVAAMPPDAAEAMDALALGYADGLKVGSLRGRLADSARPGLRVPYGARPGQQRPFEGQLSKHGHPVGSDHATQARVGVEPPPSGGGYSRRGAGLPTAQPLHPVDRAGAAADLDATLDLLAGPELDPLVLAGA